jgi:hypothetical protein
MTQFNHLAPYPKEILDLQTLEGFEQQFWVLWGTDAYKSRQACYEDLEAHHEHFYGRRKYEDYNSFRVQLSKMHHKRRKG